MKVCVKVSLRPVWAAGIKKNNALDLALIYSRTPANVAGMFTRNLVSAAPVALSKARVQNGMARSHRG